MLPGYPAPGWATTQVYPAQLFSQKPHGGLILALFGQKYEFDLAPQEIVIQIIRRRTVQRHSIVFRRQSRLAECVKYCLRAFNGGIHF